jgi:hypothetical protein
MKKSIYASILLSFIFVSCYNNPQEPSTVPVQTGTYKISGYITLDGQPLEGADVQIANALNWRTKTGPDGKFVLEGLLKGEHLFRVEKVLEENRTVSQQMNIILVDEVTNIGGINLPSPLTLYEIDASDVNNSVVSLKWNRAVTNDGFLEYKVFRKDHPSLDDKNSDLVFSSATQADTQFTEVKLRTGVKYYYRVYAYYTNQKTSGSNFQSVDIPEYNLILNPGFENSTNGYTPDNWLATISGNPTFNYFTRSQDAAHSGASSLKIYYDDAQSNPLPGRNAWGGLMQSISKNHLIEGREYVLSFWGKSINGSFQVRLVRNGNLEDPVITFIVPDKTDWSEQKFTFIVDQSNYYELWISVRPGFAVGGTTTGYIDDLKLLR